MSARPTAVVGLTAALALALTACGSDDEGLTTTTTSTSESSPAAEETTSSDEGGSEEDASGSAELVEPGTELGLGEVATIPQGDGDGAIQLTVTEIVEGEPADLEVLDDASTYDGYTPVYVHYEMTGVEESAAVAGETIDDVDPILEDGSQGQTLVIIGTSPFEKCDRNSVPDDIAVGDTETTCDVALVKDGETVVGATYAPYEGDYADDGAVTWKD